MVKAKHSTLTAQQVRVILGARRRNLVYADCAAIYNLLASNTFHGTLYDLSVALGISHQRTNRAIGFIRSSAWIEKFGWTVPFVGQGPGPKVWRVVKSVKDIKILHTGSHIRRANLRRACERLRSHFELEAKLATNYNAKAIAKAQALYLKHAVDLMDLNSKP